MTLYRYGSSSSHVSEGECDYARALELLEDYHSASLRTHETGDEAMKNTCFGLQRGKGDFLEVNCMGHQVIHLHSDRLEYPSVIARLWAQFFYPSKICFWIESDLGEAKAVISDYFVLSRADFETKYQFGLVSRGSKAPNKTA